MRHLAQLIIFIIFSGCSAGDDSANNSNNSNNWNNVNNTTNNTNNTSNTNNLNNSNNNNNANNTNNLNNSTADDRTSLLCLDARPEPSTYFMSADDSNSQAQPAWLRELILDRAVTRADLAGIPPREYEFLNYYSFDFTSGTPGSLAINPELAQDPDGSYRLLVGLTAYKVSAAGRRPFNFTFSIDTSGSMDGTPLETAKDIVRTICAAMEPGDVVSIVDWDFYTHTLLSQHVIQGPDDQTVSQSLSQLSASGATNLYRGLVKAYEIANANYSTAYLNRVILISDGNANVGVTEADLIGQEAAKEEGDGIFLIGLGTSDIFDHEFMDTVTDLGKGAYLYIPDAAEAEKMFSGSRVYANTEIAALNVRLQVTLPSMFVVREFHGEQISSIPTEVRPQHLSPNDSMLYHLQLEDCGSEEEETGFIFTATWQSPFSGEPRTLSRTLTLSELLLAPATNLEKADLVIAYARLLVNASSLSAEDQETRRLDLLGQINTYLETSEDPDMMEISAVLEAF